MRQTRLFLFFWLCAFMACLSTAQAGATEWRRTEYTALRVLDGGMMRTAKGEEARLLGLEFTLQPGWKVYWRDPGDAGYAMTLHKEGSSNIRALEILWPAPHRYVEDLGADFGTLESLGYGKHVIYPVHAYPEHAGKPMHLQVKVDYMTCADICVPYEASFALPLEPDAPPEEDVAGLMKAAVARVPGENGAGGLKIEKVRYVPEEGKEGAGYLEVTAASKELFAQPDVFVWGAENYRFSQPRLLSQPDAHHIVLAAPYERQSAAKSLEDAALTLTLVDGAQAVAMPWRVASEAEGVAATAAEKGSDLVLQTMSGETAGAGPALVLMLLFAFLGGLILNIMPCVLPVLSLKLMKVAHYSGAEARDVRTGFLISAAGILTSFWILAAITIGLRGAGTEVGWGFHFQEPYFLIFIIIVLALFGTSLWGWFDIQAPSWAGSIWSPKTTREAGRRDHPYLGHFMTGLLATLLATPCSAPFLGTAIGFALSGSGAHIALIFTAMGVGLAAPYLLVAAFPAMVALLPRPGVWMVKVKAVLGALLLATALWLLWVLSHQLGLPPAIILVLTLTLVLMILRDHHRRGEESRVLRRAGFTVLFLTALILPASHEIPAAAGGKDAAEKGLWQPFDEARIAGLTEEGYTVFVDVTADWCLTCKANKLLVLDRDPVRTALAQPHIIAMKADWTRRDPHIGAYLAQFGRYGIPFNAVYHPGEAAPRLLPELLSADAVSAALAEK